MIRRIVLAAAMVALSVPAAPAAASSPGYAWQAVTADLRGRADDFLARLKPVRAALIRRAEKEAPDLVSRLYLKKPDRAGYGVLPEVGKEASEKPVDLLRTEFSLKALAARTARDADALSRLDGRAAAEPEAPLGDLVKEFERLRDRLRTLEKNISYHDFWQRNAAGNPRYYAGRNELAGVIGELMALRAKGGASARMAALERQVRDRVVPFTRVRPGLAPAMEQRADGALVLPVTIATDIADEGFLDKFRESVRDLISRSAAARKRRFSIDLRLRRIPAGTLYPDGAPQPGVRIDTDAHLARFPKDSYVMTTGAESTHVRGDRAIMLGPGSASRRTLAHEFLHLLGFADTYVRSYTGDPKDPFGVTFVEWTGLTDDLMSAPGHGRVSDAIIAALIEAYSNRPPAGAPAR